MSSSHTYMTEVGNPVPFSLSAIGWARDIVVPDESAKNGLSSTGTKFVLVYLATRVNESHACWEKYANIATKCQVSAVSAKRSVAHLRAVGLLRTVQTVRTGRLRGQGTTVFVLNTSGWLDDIPDAQDAMVRRLQYLAGQTDVESLPKNHRFA